MQSIAGATRSVGRRSPWPLLFATAAVLATATACSADLEVELDDEVVCEEGEECASRAEEEALSVEVQSLTQGGINRTCSNTVHEKRWSKPTGMDWSSEFRNAHLQECAVDEVLVGIRGWEDTRGRNQGIRNLQAVCQRLMRVGHSQSSTRAPAFQFGRTRYPRGPVVGAQHVGANVSLSCPWGQAVSGIGAYSRTGRVWGMYLKCVTPVGTTSSSRTISRRSMSYTKWAGIKKDSFSSLNCQSGELASGLQSLNRDKAIGSLSLSCSHVAQKPMCDRYGRLEFSEAKRRFDVSTSLLRSQIRASGWREKAPSISWEYGTWLYNYQYQRGVNSLQVLGSVERVNGAFWGAKGRFLSQHIKLGNGWVRGSVTDLVNDAITISEHQYNNAGTVVAVRDKVTIGPIRGKRTLADRLTVGRTTKKFPYRFNGNLPNQHGHVISLLNPLGSNQSSLRTQSGRSLSVQQVEYSKRELCEEASEDGLHYLYMNNKRYQENCDTEAASMRKNASWLAIDFIAEIGKLGPKALVILKDCVKYGRCRDQDVAAVFGLDDMTGAMGAAEKCYTKHGCDDCRKNSDCSARGSDYICTDNYICQSQAYCQQYPEDCTRAAREEGCVPTAGNSCGPCYCPPCGYINRPVRSCRGECLSCSGICENACTHF